MLTTLGPNGAAFVQRYAAFTGSSLHHLSRSVDAYNTDYSSYGNEVYERIETRLVHWANYLDHGWFQHRLDYPLLRALDFDLVIDIGFSAPYAFLAPHLRDNCRTQFLFVDREPSTLAFMNTLIAMEGWDVAGHSRVLIADIETRNGRQECETIVRSAEPHSILVIASEVLEHLTDSNSALNWLAHGLASAGRATSAIYLTLPIGHRIPSHTLEFLSRDEADAFCSALVPIKHSYVITNATPASSPYLQAVYCAWSEHPSPYREKAL